MTAPSPCLPSRPVLYVQSKAACQRRSKHHSPTDRLLVISITTQPIDCLLSTSRLLYIASEKVFSYLAGSIPALSWSQRKSGTSLGVPPVIPLLLQESPSLSPQPRLLKTSHGWSTGRATADCLWSYSWRVTGQVSVGMISATYLLRTLL